MKVTFFCQDSGPANYIASFLENNNNLDYKIFASNISSKIFNNYNLINTVIDAKTNDLTEVCNLVITGTCLGHGIDKYGIQFAKMNKIPSVSIVEHWTNYRERFEINNVIFLPDYILLNDYIAKKQAISAGIPEEKIIVVGNPVLEKKYHQTKNLQINSKKFRVALNISEEDKIVLFISENFKSDYLKDSTLYLGFDEYDALGAVNSCLDYNCHLIIKLHPSDNINKYNEFLEKNKKVKTTILSNISQDELIPNVDIIVGMGSMYLLEAAIYRNDVISYWKSTNKSFIGNQLKVTHRIQSKEELKAILINQITVKNKNFGELFIGSLQRISNFIKNIQL